MVGLVVIKQKCLENYFPDTKNQRDVRSAFIRLFGTCISLPLKRIHYKIKGEVFWLGVILLIFLLSFHQWIIDHSSPLQQQGLPQTYTAFPFPLDLFSFFLSPERPAPLISITHWLQISRTFWLFYNSFDLQNIYKKQFKISQYNSFNLNQKTGTLQTHECSLPYFVSKLFAYLVGHLVGHFFRNYMNPYNLTS